jgi:hypothetical protein
MGQFGAFQINRECGIAYGGDPHVELTLEPGRYEPQSSAEFDALMHLTTVPVADVEGEGGEVVPGEPFAEKLEDAEVAPEGAHDDVVATAPMAEPVLSEPPAAPVDPAATGDKSEEN